MKSKIIAATIAAALIVTFISCNWFKRKQTQAFNIEGKWTIDSIENKSSDSSKNIGAFILALAAQDSSQLGIQFNNDSTYNYINANDSTKGKYYFSEDKNSLFLNEDSITHQFDFIMKTDSVISFASTDSIFYYLKRK